MIIQDNIISYLKFDNNTVTTVFDDVSPRYFTINGGDDGITVNENGMKFVEGQYLSDNNFININLFDITIGFKLFSVNPGLSNYGSDINVNMAVLGFSVFDTILSDNVPFIFVYESTSIVNNKYTKNNINVRIYDSNSNITITSSQYDASLQHDFWIEMQDVNTGLVNIYIDGVLSETTVSGSLTGVALASSLPSTYYINKILQTDETNFIQHYGYIDKLFVLNTSDVYNKYEVFKNIYRYGLEYTEDGTVNSYFCVNYDDEQTKEISSSLSIKSSMYLGFNTGEIAQTIPTIWEYKKNFNKLEELSSLKFSSNIEYTNENGFLKLTNGMIQGL